ncbi:MAG: phenylalanine--tRNA ligase subunit beta [Ilumatobacteraceae bacterium]
MKIVRSWLEEFARFSDAASDDVIADALTALGLSVESIDVVGASVPGVVAARVVRTERHPDAAKVHRVWVDAGDGVQRHVWCGAFNMAAGDVVPLATLGTTMPDGRRIERRAILGIDSEGMLCSADELGVSSDASGILILDPSVAPGTDFSAVVGGPEVVFDLDVTRNRPDCLGHLGVARDLAAHFKVRLNPPRGDTVRRGSKQTLPVKIIDTAGCARFSLTVMSGIVVGPSPAHHARRLAAAGMRSINNVVDASNLVMLELNQPNHAYDADVVGKGMRVRRARDGETLVTLDGVTRRLTSADLLICNAADEAIGLAGIMGGEEGEVRDSTTTVALEVAWFDPSTVRETSQRLSLRSEASARFERGVDPQGVALAASRFAALLRESCPQLVVHSGATDVRTAKLPTPATMTLRLSEVQRVLGTAVPARTATALLERIGFTVRSAPAKSSARRSGSGSATKAGAVLKVKAPSWRHDCTAEVDLIEELARHIGYDALGKHVSQSTEPGGLSPVQKRRRALRDVVMSLGCSEAMPSPFLAPGDHEAAGIDVAAGVVSLTNPLVAEESVLRLSLRPGLLRAVHFNQSHRAADIALFELGHVYPTSTAELPDEHESLCLVAAGCDAATAMHWWTEISAVLGVGAQIDQTRVPAGFHPTRSASLARGSVVLGAVGEIDPRVLRRLGIDGRVACLEVNASRILADTPAPAAAKPVSRFPASDFDLAFMVPAKVTAQQVQRALRTAGGALVEDVRLFDVYRTDVAAASRSLAFAMRLRAGDRTLTDDDVAAVREKCVTAAVKLGAELRSS